ncbi:MAG: hypothetical protein HY331_10710 [Chloroflexi bacterium]|nr:hypothetical protein [Chloroflexota bacterium]
MQRIKSFGVLQTAKFAAVFYLLTTAVFLVPAAIIGTAIAILSGDERVVLFPALLLFAPLFYAAIGFVFVAVGCLIYNLIAQWVGGIEVEMEEAPAEQT